MTTRQYEATWRYAVAAATKAEAATKAARFGVVQHQNPLDDTSPVVKAWDNGGRGYEAEGTALVRVNGNSGFGRWLKANAAKLTVTYTDHYGGTARDGAPYVSTGGYYGGVVLGTPPRGYERSVNWAAAFVAAVNEKQPKARATYFTFMD
jgi:hypothetical protein